LVASRVAHPRVHTGRAGGTVARITLRIDHPRLQINGTARYAVHPYVARVMTRGRCAATQTHVSPRRGGRIKEYVLNRVRINEKSCGYLRISYPVQDVQRENAITI